MKSLRKPPTEQLFWKVPNVPPAPHELEVSVFGPGVGECVVIHVGDGEWIIVDSCINRESGEPIALDYLGSLGVDVASQVKLVVATHWHDDHIDGLSKVLRAAEGAKFVDSIAHRRWLEFVQLVDLGSQTAPVSSATSEFASILDILFKRRRKGERPEAVGPMHAIADRKLLALKGPGRSFEVEVVSLSPADGVISLADAQLAEAMAAVRQRRRPARPGPNQLCVVLWLKLGVLNAILGADLEHVPGVTEGWRAIVDSATRPDGKAAFFKVSHHGSRNADCPECWSELLAPRPMAVVTAYSRSGLPRRQDLDRLCERAQQVFLTSPTRFSTPRRVSAVEKTLKEVAIKRRALTGKMGHVRLRADARNDSTKPAVFLQNGATEQCAATR